jgi:hypothetical protein
MLHVVPTSPRSSASAGGRALPTPDQLAALDVGGFVRRLDRNLATITDESSLASLFPPGLIDNLRDDPRACGAGALFRSTLRGTLVATSFRALPEEARVHPAVQARLWSAIDEVDTAVHGVSDALEALTTDERNAISRALRDDPSLGARVLEALDTEAQKAGVAGERRDQLRKIGQQACFRLRQSTSGFIEEYTEKVRKSQPRSAADSERYLRALRGGGDLREERAWQFGVMEEWQKLLAAQASRLAGPDEPAGFSADDAYAPPTTPLAPPGSPPGGYDPNSGKKVLKVGAYLFGIGVMVGATSGLLVSTSNDTAVITGLFGFTAAALLTLGGTVCLLIGAILRATARSRQRAELGF